MYIQFTFNHTSKLCFQCVHTFRIVHFFLLLPGRLALELFGREGSPFCSSLLLAEVEWLVLAACVQLLQVAPLVVVDDCQHTGNGLPNNFTAYRKRDRKNQFDRVYPGSHITCRLH